MSEQLEKDLKRIQDSTGRMAKKASQEGKVLFGKIVKNFADLVEDLEKKVVEEKAKPKPKK